MKMTEKAKMRSGAFYDSRDDELLAMYHRARRLMRAFNEADSTETDRKNAILAELLGFKGQGVWIEAPFFCDYGEHIVIGDNTFINFNCVFLDSSTIVIGQNCLIAPNVQIYTAFHPLRAAERIHPGGLGAPYKTQAAPVAIGNNVWIGGNAVIFPGVTIGDNTTIGAGSVVTGDIPANMLAYGNPCKVIREIA